MPRTAGFDRHAKLSRIDWADTEVKETEWNAIADGQCNWNEED